MADPLDNVNEVMEELQGAALHTTAGSFVRVEHVERLLKRRREAADEAKQKRLEEPPPKTFKAASHRAARDLKEQMGPQAPREPGRSVAANQPPQPPSRA
jgi:hypothetical protein